MVCRTALNRCGNQLTCVLIRLILRALHDLTQLDRCVVLCLVLNRADQIFLRLFAGQSGDFLQTGDLFALELIRFLDCLLCLCKAAGQFLGALLCRINLAVECLLLLGQTALGLLCLGTAFPDFALQIRAAFVNLILCFKNRFALLVFSSLDGIVNDALGFFLRASDFLFRNLFPIGKAGQNTDYDTDDCSNNDLNQ